MYFHVQSSLCIYVYFKIYEDIKYDFLCFTRFKKINVHILISVIHKYSKLYLLACVGLNMTSLNCTN